ncbi:FecR family protein [Pseudomonas sp. DC3000-4b1]|uniref:FecR family protein n=1 Tax=unclassified Pseudomonas TaxID=196821 RepID=UPI003CEDE2F1
MTEHPLTGGAPPESLARSANRQAADWLLRIQASPEDLDLPEQLAQWLNEHESHPKAYAKAQRAWGLAAGLAPPAAPEAQASPVSVQARPRKRRRLAWLSSAAAAVLIALGAYQHWLPGADYRTGVGERKTIELADGSQVQLDTDSAVAVRFEVGGRHVELLRGQAFFKVTHNASRPFLVDAGPITVTVTGTAFEVRTGPDGARVEVAQGSVRVAMPNASVEVLKAGDSLRADASGMHEATLTAVQIAPWRNGRLAVNGQSVAEVVREIDRYLPGTVLMPNDELGQRKVTGLYDIDQPEQALRSVLQPWSARLRQLAPYIYVVEEK